MKRNHYVTRPIGPLQAKTLAEITQMPGQSVYALANRLSCNVGAVSNAVFGLEKRGLIVTVVDRLPSGQTGRLCCLEPW